MDNEALDQSSAATKQHGDILTAMSVPFLDTFNDPQSLDPVFSMLHPATSATPSMGFIPSSTTDTSPVHAHQAPLFWQAAGGSTPCAPPPPTPPPTAHRHSMPDLKHTQASTRRQRRRTEGGLFGNDGDGDGAGAGDDNDQRRQMFLERNRQAAFKCRLRKKQWLANLQSQVEFMDADNRQVEHQVLRLREEILNLKTLIVAHKDCPIAEKQQQAHPATTTASALLGPFAAHHQPMQPTPFAPSSIHR